MKPEAAAYLDKGLEFLRRAPALLTQGFVDEAGRAAYLAGFHAAQAFIFEAKGRSPRTHNGVQSEFARLVKDELSIDAQLRSFLGRTYNLKAIADYDTGPRAKVTQAQAAEAITAAQQFTAAIKVLLRF